LYLKKCKTIPVTVRVGQAGKHLAANFLLPGFVAYTLVMKMEAIISPEPSINFSRLQDVTFEKIMLFKAGFYSTSIF
jgi:hypothetical protein